MAKTILIRENLTYADLINNTKDVKVKTTLQELANAGLSGYIMSNAHYTMSRPHPFSPIEDYKANPVKNLYDWLKSGMEAVIEDLDGSMFFVKETANDPDADKTVCTDSVPFLVSYTFNSLYKRVNAETRKVLKPIADSKDQALKNKFMHYLPAFIGWSDNNRWTLDRVQQVIIRSKQGLYHCMGIEQ